jgi:SAM-dependent methyltransferase
MLDFLKYEFGYSWYITYGHLVPLGLAAGLGVLTTWRGWPRPVMVLASVIAVWSVAGLVFSTGLNTPMPLPTDRFLGSGSGRVLDVGAGSGRAAIGLLLARPRATAVGLDIYSGYFGIDDNTPDRFMANARIAGVADRADTRTGDMRALPFSDREFDAVVSAYAIDHLPQRDIGKALSEVARVVKAQGEFLLSIVNPDLATFILSPPIAHHRRPDPAWWRGQLDTAGFALEEEGTRIATLYFLARKRS